MIIDLMRNKRKITPEIWILGTKSLTLNTYMCIILQHVHGQQDLSISLIQKCKSGWINFVYYHCSACGHNKIITPCTCTSGVYKAICFVCCLLSS